MSHYETAAEEREQIFEDRALWLASLGARSTDVLLDEDNNEFIYVESESGSPGDDYQIDNVKVLLPYHIQLSTISNYY